MAIDHIIDYDCVPKQTLTTPGILERLKGLARAEAIIATYRREGDNRPPSEMEFEFSHRTGDGQDITMVVNVRHLIDEGADLEPLTPHCRDCPANRSGKPFGCMNFIQYPVSAAGEAWLLNQLPGSEAPLVYLLLQKGIIDFQYDGKSVEALRSDGVYFESPAVPARHLGDFLVNANQVYEMIFTVGNIIPNHASMLLLFFHAIRRDLQANELVGLTPAPPDVLRKHAFVLDIKPNDETTTREFKEFLHALYIAWTLNVRLLIDA